ncbi:hypothetical protein [Variovorax sp. JS1663]|uniref:hypothetical protein n=1 Tax=Variovorax sp. JS1663 TaxID=1851577 RepID=UPI00130266B5|nr:hypothetical protein [Variovorax sp. JS1663]
MTPRHEDRRQAGKHRSGAEHERLARESDSPVPTRPAEDGEQPQSPGAKPLEKKQQQQH